MDYVLADGEVFGEGMNTELVLIEVRTEFSYTISMNINL